MNGSTIRTHVPQHCLALLFSAVNLCRSDRFLHSTVHCLAGSILPTNLNRFVGVCSIRFGSPQEPHQEDLVRSHLTPTISTSTHWIGSSYHICIISWSCASSLVLGYQPSPVRSLAAPPPRCLVKWRTHVHVVHVQVDKFPWCTGRRKALGAAAAWGRHDAERVTMHVSRWSSLEFTEGGWDAAFRGRVEEWCKHPSMGVVATLNGRAR
jgi:hypothetical protein